MRGSGFMNVHEVQGRVQKVQGSVQRSVQRARRPGQLDAFRAIADRRSRTVESAVLRVPSAVSANYIQRRILKNPSMPSDVASMNATSTQKNVDGPRPKCGRSTFMPYRPVMNVSGMKIVAI